MSKAETISIQIGVVKTTVTFCEVLRIGTTRMRVVIESNFYEFQSAAAVSVWSNEERAWNIVHQIMPAKMKTPHTLISRRPFCIERKEEEIEKVGLQMFRDDRNELLRVAAEVVGFEFTP
jgi:hypothetical protein